MKRLVYVNFYNPFCSPYKRKTATYNTRKSLIFIVDQPGLEPGTSRL